MPEPQCLDPSLIAAVVGAGGSIFGALAGAVIGYRLNNSKADLDVYIDNKIILYYMEKYFAVYLPISIVNEGSKSATISAFKLTLKSSTGQMWNLIWYCFAENDFHTNGQWREGKLATPILVHGNSGSQQYLKFIEYGLTSQEWSNVSLPAGRYFVELEILDRHSKLLKTTRSCFNIGTEVSEMLAKRRTDPEDFTTCQLDAEPSLNDT